MGEVECVMNGRPTVLGGNLDLWNLQGARLGALPTADPLGSMWPLELVAHVAHALSAWVGLRKHESLLSSLVRRSWMGFTEEAHRGVPQPSEQTAQEGEAVPRLCRFDAGEWRLHLQRDHLPYRKDCRVCVERSTGKPHRKVSHPAAYTLSVDTAGPFREKGAAGHRYLLVALSFSKVARHQGGRREGRNSALITKPLLVRLMGKTGCLIIQNLLLNLEPLKRHRMP